MIGKFKESCHSTHRDQRQFGHQQALSQAVHGPLPKWQDWLLTTFWQASNAMFE